MTGKTPFFSALRLHAEVFIWRQGSVWAWVFLLLMVSGGLLITQRWVLQPQHRVHTEALEALRSSRIALKQTQLSATQQAPDPFTLAQASLQSVMVHREALPDIIRSIHAAAHRHRIVVQSSDYQLKEQGRDGPMQQTITLPMRVGYDRFKPFLFDVLRAHPGMAVEQISIKREAVAQSTPEIVLRLSVWVHPMPTTAESVRP